MGYLYWGSSVLILARISHSKITFHGPRQGLIGITASGSTAAMVELNCETDFVARNEQFHAIVEQLAAALVTRADSLCVDGEASRLEGEALQTVSAGSAGQTLKDVVALGKKNEDCRTQFGRYVG